MVYIINKIIVQDVSFKSELSTKKYHPMTALDDEVEANLADYIFFQNAGKCSKEQYYQDVEDIWKRRHVQSPYQLSTGAEDANNWWGEKLADT